MSDFAMIHTDASLLERIRKASSKKMSASEVNAQRISYIFGSVKKDGITRTRIQEVLENQEGKKG